ncbi:trim39 [Pungitius sinensis]
MSSASFLPAKEPFLCGLCLDVFTDPATLPCGHNFCRTCVTRHRDSGTECRCHCYELPFHGRPDLPVNSFISEMAARFRESAGGDGLGSTSRPIGRRSLRRLHWEQRKGRAVLPGVPGLLLRRPPAAAPDGTTPAEASAGRACGGPGGLIQERRSKVQEIKHMEKLSRQAADRETADGVQVLTGLIRSLERTRAELIGAIEATRKATRKASEEQAEGFVRELEQEVSELIRQRP